MIEATIAALLFVSVAKGLMRRVSCRDIMLAESQHYRIAQLRGAGSGALSLAQVR